MPNGTISADLLGANAGGFGWRKNAEGVDYGWIDIVDQTGTGKYTADLTPDTTVVIDNPAGWGYTDSKGNALQTSGRAIEQQSWNLVRRNLDLTNVDPSLLRETAGEVPLGFDLNHPVPALGVGGSELWVSFLAQGTGESRLGGWDLFDGAINTIQKNIALGRPWRLNATGGPADEGTGWGISDRQHVDDGGLSVGKIATGDLATAGSDKVFIVQRFTFYDAFQPIPNDPDTVNEFGDDHGTVWVNPDLDATPSDASAAIPDFFITDLAVMGLWFTGNNNTILDEIRFGFSYADVAPIAAGPNGDFDGDLDVDGADFLKWQRDLGDTNSLVDWEANFGAAAAVSAVASVPEPASLLLVGVVTTTIAAMRRRSLIGKVS